MRLWSIVLSCDFRVLSYVLSLLWGPFVIWLLLLVENMECGRKLTGIVARSRLCCQAQIGEPSHLSGTDGKRVGSDPQHEEQHPRAFSGETVTSGMWPHRLEQCNQNCRLEYQITRQSDLFYLRQKKPSADAGTLSHGHQHEIPPLKEVSDLSSSRPPLVQNKISVEEQYKVILRVRLCHNIPSRT